jgi:alpha-L-rhamnosidase
MKKTVIRILTLSLFVMMSVTMFAAKKAAAVSVTDLRTELLTNPMSVDTSTPRVGWRIVSTQKDVMQTGYHIIVSTSEEKLQRNEGDLWDADVVSDQSQWITYAGKPLKSNTRCYWKVKVNTTKGESAWSQPAMWNIGLLGESHWTSQWIGYDGVSPWDVENEHSRLSARYLRKEFAVDKQIKQATLYICGLGLYELYVNGQRIGDQVLAPSPTDYRKTVLYNAFDVTNLVQGNNAVGVVLGNGRYYTMQQKKKPFKIVNFGYPRMRMDMIIEYTDGTQKIVASDETWKLNLDGPVRSANEYDGEIYDARKEFDGWAVAGFNDKSWKAASHVQDPGGTLRGMMNPYMKVVRTLKPVSIVRKGNGYILDMGQNFAGWVKMKVRGGKAGDVIRLRYGETIKGDTLYIENLRMARSTDYYTVRGDENGREWAPSFVYHGGRYIEVTGYENPTQDDFIGEVVSDEMRLNGTFSCSDTILNKVYRNSEWGILSNYKGMPTDCPQRDERQPWLGDRTRGCVGESFVFENAQLYAKWVRDICESQREDGCIPDVAPHFINYYSDNVTWPSALAFSVDMLYQQYGDILPMKSAYPNIKRWLQHLKDEFEVDGLMPRDKYGDWCMPPESPELIHSMDPARNTDGTLLATAYYYRMYKMMERFAGLLGMQADAEYFSREASRVKKAFNDKFLVVNKNTSVVPGSLLYPDSTFYGNNTATANILPYAFGMIDDDYVRGEVVKNIIRNIETLNGGSISTGVIGTSWLMRALTEMGRCDIAWQIATNKNFPSWGYMAEHGATTIWELWNGDTANPRMNSANHVMLLGDLIPWIYQDLAGINPDAGEVGYKHIILKPTFGVDEIYDINASYNTLYGKIVSTWKKNNGKLLWHVEIPANTTADVYLPDGTKQAIGSGAYDFSAVMPVRDPSIVTDEFLYKTAPFPQCHAATIVELKDGSLVSAFFGGMYERHPGVCIYVCRKAKGAHEWTKPQLVADGTFPNAPRKACWNPVLYQIPGGDLMLYFKIGSSVSDWTGWYVSSKNGGKTWSKRVQLPDGILGPIKNKPIYNKGRIISPSSYESGGWRLHFELSDDNGKTWRKTADVIAKDTIKAIQPTILVLPDGRLEALCRTRSRHIGITFSNDNGETWSELDLIDTPNNNSGLDAVNMNDGRYALVCNNMPIEPDKAKGPRTPLSIGYSTDGIHWGDWVTLEDSPISQYSYPSVIQGADGHLHIVYTWRRLRVKHVEIK